ncbi:MAG: PorT family protein, partial [Prevotella salivae]|nr:PorT family protein [Segatella salivae]
MKKNIIVTLLLSLFSLSISAQYTKGDFFIQPRLGLNMSKFVGSGLLYSPKWKAGYEAGVEAEWFVSTHNSLSFSLAYRQIGCGFNYKEIDDMWYMKGINKLERLNTCFITSLPFGTIKESP